MSDDHLKSWIGRSEYQSETLLAGPLDRLQATLDREGPRFAIGDPVPPLWHWVFFNPLSRGDELGEDGHPRRGGFVPPVSSPRRMWVGGCVCFDVPLMVGDFVERESRIDRISPKVGRSGSLTLVTVAHNLRSVKGGAICETQNLMYLGVPNAPPTISAAEAPCNETFKREFVPNTTLLFRYSALTFNSHRIHYDRRYAQATEGYPGLVVQGPLIATLLLDLLLGNCPEANVRHFAFKAIRPLFDAQPVALCGRQTGSAEFALWARDFDGNLAMEAQARIA